MNWGFTQPGLYVLSVAGRITGPAGVLTSETYRYRVCVIEESGAAAATLDRVCSVSGPSSSPAAASGNARSRQLPTPRPTAVGDAAAMAGGTGAVQLNVEIPPCGLGLRVDAGATTLVGQTLRNGMRSLTGELPPVTVVSCQAEGWTVMGVASEFVGTDGSSFPATWLGWTPSAGAADLAAPVQTGGPIEAGPNPTDGLQVSRVLGGVTPENGVAPGIATFGAELTLSVPISVPPGTYTSTLTLSVIGP
jgi:hypothetical protein